MANGNADDACSWLSPDGQLRLNQIANDLASTGTVPCTEGLEAIYDAVPSFKDDARNVQIEFDGGGTKETPTYLATFGPYVWEVELLLNVDHFTIMAIWDKSEDE